MDKIKHHDKLPIMVNENCAIALPKDALQKLLQPHKLAYYYFVFVDQGSETVKVDLQDISLSDRQVVFGLPNQIFAHSSSNKASPQYKIGFDENALALLPRGYPFLVNPLQSSVITFDPDAKERVVKMMSDSVHFTSKSLFKRFRGKMDKEN